MSKTTSLDIDGMSAEEKIEQIKMMRDLIRLKEKSGDGCTSAFQKIGKKKNLISDTVMSAVFVTINTDNQKKKKKLQLKKISNAIILLIFLKLSYFLKPQLQACCILRHYRVIDYHYPIKPIMMYNVRIYIFLYTLLSMSIIRMLDNIRFRGRQRIIESRHFSILDLNKNLKQFKKYILKNLSFLLELSAIEAFNLTAFCWRVLTLCIFSHKSSRTLGNSAIDYILKQLINRYRNINLNSHQFDQVCTISAVRLKFTEYIDITSFSNVTHVREESLNELIATFQNISFGGNKAIFNSDEVHSLSGCTTWVSSSKIPSANIVTAFKIIELLVDNVSNTHGSYTNDYLVNNIKIQDRHTIVFSETDISVMSRTKSYWNSLTFIRCFSIILPLNLYYRILELENHVIPSPVIETTINWHFPALI
ncbi:hypothetical protein AGLY_004566 [Aphis glycines]|uniref:Uncharacterized protein n=1 Tax=Aphis glycines TaxID=307491 RepID=A0A6G0TZC0_APHGL|nr:hypothetical protein AGLY_004566 [Aphis glycines]